MRVPAEIVRAEPLPQIMAATPASRHALLARARKLERQGYLRVVDRAPQWNPAAEHYELRVIPLRPPAPAWIRPAIIAGVILFVFSLLAGLACWALAALSTPSLAALLLVVLVVFTLGVARAHHHHSTTVVVRVTTH